MDFCFFFFCIVNAGQTSLNPSMNRDQQRRERGGPLVRRWRQIRPSYEWIRQRPWKKRLWPIPQQQQLPSKSLTNIFSFSRLVVVTVSVAHLDLDLDCSLYVCSFQPLPGDRRHLRYLPSRRTHSSFFRGKEKGQRRRRRDLGNGIHQSLFWIWLESWVFESWDLSLGFLNTSVYSRVPLLLCSLILPPASKKNCVRPGSFFKRKWKRSAQLFWWRNFYVLDTIITWMIVLKV